MEYTLASEETYIKSLVVRERFYRDSCQWDKLRHSYHPDPSKTSIRISWFEGDIDGFVGGSKEMAAKGLSAIHNINPVEVNINGFKAFSISVGNIMVRFGKEGSEYDIISHCRFISRLQKVDEEGGQSWKILTMEVIYIQDSIVPVFPQSGRDALAFGNWKAAERKSYRYLSWLLEQQGHEVRVDLPGVDDEESVKDVMFKNTEWMRSRDS